MIRWGLLGTAHINRRLIPAMRAARRSTVVAVAGRDAQRVQAYAREWQIPGAHTGYETLLRDHSVDAVYVPLPNAMHVEWTLRALDAGKHVLCEKPLALLPDDVDRIAAVARARGLVVAEGFMYRHEPLFARVLDLVRGQTLGPLRFFSSGFTFMQSRENDVRLDAALGGGSLWDIGCYAVNAVRAASGAEPIEVSGSASLTSTGVDESFTGMLRFADGLTASIYSSFRAEYGNWFEAVGSKATLRITNLFRPPLRAQLEVRRQDTRETFEVEGTPMHFVREVEDFVAAVLDDRAPAVTLADSRGNAATLAALHAAARSRTTVSVAP